MGATINARVVFAASALSTALGCSLLVGDDLTSEAPPPPSPGAGEAGVTRDADTASDAGTTPDATELPSGIFVRGFAKAPRKQSTGLQIGRPPNTQAGDVLLLLIRWIGTLDRGTFTEIGRRGGCPVTSNGGGYLWWGYRVAADTDPASWPLGSSNNASGEALLLAIAGARPIPLEDSNGAIQDAGAPTALPVQVQSELARIFAVFASPTPMTWPTPPGLTSVTSTEGIGVFTAVHPRGTTPTYAMPGAPPPTCTLTATLAYGPR